jgi:hypothetical protein
VATFSTLSINKAGTGYTLTANDGSLTTATSSTFNITPAAASQVVFTGEPSNTVAGVSISPAVVVSVEDAYGNVVTSYTSQVTVAIGTNPASGTLSGTTTVTAVSGVATFSTLSINKAGTGYTLTAAVSSLTSGTSTAFNISVAAASKVVFTSEPSNTVAGVSISPAVQVSVEDAFGNVVTSNTSNVTVEIGTNPGSGSLSGNATQPAVAGIATFSNLSINKVGTGYTFTANDSFLTGGTSSTFNITPSAATHFTVTAPATATAGIAVAFTVTAQDAYGNTATGYSGTVHFTSTDTQATLPANSTLTSGVGNFTATLKTSGTQSLTATDTVTSSITGSASITVSSGLLVTNTLDSGSGSLRWAVNLADTSTIPLTITFSTLFTTAQTITLTSGELLLTDSYQTTVEGPGSGLVTISGNNASQVFLVASGASATISGATISKGVASTSGGGVECLGTLTITNCVLTSNSAEFGGGVYSSGTLSVTNSTLNGDSASYGGGVYINSGTLTVSGSALRGNTASTDGGGIYNAGTAMVTLSTLSGNLATGSSALNGGGILNYGTMTVTGSTLSSNSAANAGGGIWNDGTFTASSSTLSANSALTGGGIDNYNAGSMSLTGSTLTKNTASEGGDGIYDTGTALSLTNTTLSGNSGGSNGGGIDIAQSKGTATIMTSSFINNVASVGGGIDNNSSSTVSVTVTGSTLSGNSATGGSGGGIENIGNLSVTSTSLSSNSASNVGGGISSDAGTLMISNSTLSANAATSEGGGINTNSTSMSLASSVVTSNTAPFGAGIYNANSLTVTSSNISGNMGAYGGGIYTASGTVTVTNSTLGGNLASTGSGGGIYSGGSSLIVTSSTLASNIATFYGGGIDSTSGSMAVIDSTFSLDKAGNGGAIYNGSSVSVTVTCSTVSGNSANTAGSGIQNQGTLTLDSCIVAGNSTAADYTGSVAASSSYNLIGNGSSLTGISNGTNHNQIGTSAIPINPLLSVLGNYGGPTQTMYELPAIGSQPRSPAIGGGDPAAKNASGATLTTDERGFTRTVSGRTDIGAFENQGSGVTTHFAVTIPGTATAGTSVNITITAQDDYNSTVVGYTGTVHFTSSDASATLPANVTLTNGVGTVSCTFKTAGSQTFTATDTANGIITCTSSSVTVSAAAVSGFLITTPPAASAGLPFTFSVTAVDQYGNIITGYTGTIHFTSTDPSPTLPQNATLTNGVGSFQATLSTVGNQYITATDTTHSNLVGTCTAIEVDP